MLIARLEGASLFRGENRRLAADTPGLDDALLANVQAIADSLV